MQNGSINILQKGVDMMAKCPRCGAEMSGGICNNCGFPMNRRRIKAVNSVVIINMGKYGRSIQLNRK